MEHARINYIKSKRREKRDEGSEEERKRNNMNWKERERKEFFKNVKFTKGRQTTTTTKKPVELREKCCGSRVNVNICRMLESFAMLLLFSAMFCLFIIAPPSSTSHHCQSTASFASSSSAVHKQWKREKKSGKMSSEQGKRQHFPPLSSSSFLFSLSLSLCHSRLTGRMPLHLHGWQKLTANTTLAKSAQCSGDGGSTQQTHKKRY